MHIIFGLNIGQTHLAETVSILLISGTFRQGFWCPIIQNPPELPKSSILHKVHIYSSSPLSSKANELTTQQQSKQQFLGCVAKHIHPTKDRQGKQRAKLANNQNNPNAYHECTPVSAINDGNVMQQSVLCCLVFSIAMMFQRDFIPHRQKPYHSRCPEMVTIPPYAPIIASFPLLPPFGSSSHSTAEFKVTSWSAMAYWHNSPLNPVPCIWTILLWSKDLRIIILFNTFRNIDCEGLGFLIHSDLLHLVRIHSPRALVGVLYGSFFLVCVSTSFFVAILYQLASNGLVAPDGPN
ncbi:hypothetical protein PROFUN_10223 [Planoprotostelium fungivorum]|uniref:Uncharacterized protein n=1 Tax=Planoprotostelium fungivorum TaxID=1890364 RepID=A0A2P6MQ76_9EUKA|nr:hypothetical protein PROFUN_10223 [Planoprotostelium fungivorum]